MVRRKEKRVVVIVDHQNIFSQAREQNIPIERVYSEIVGRAQELGEVVDVRAFIPTYQVDPSSWNEINTLEVKYGISVEACPVLRAKETFKDVVDLTILNWVTKYSDCADLVIFVTGDGDFIVAINQLKGKGKETEVWTASFSNTSDALFVVAPVKELSIAGKQIVVSKANPFLESLARATRGNDLTKEGKRNVNLLREVEKTLPSLIKGGVSLSALRERVEEQFGIAENTCQAILETLMGLEVIKTHQQLITVVTFHPSSQLQSLGAVLHLNIE